MQDLINSGSEIDWAYYISARNKKIAITAPKNSAKAGKVAYLLLPEVHSYLSFASNPDHYYLLNTIWHTGAQISEICSLTPNDVILEAEQPTIQLGHHSQIADSTNRRRSATPRAIPITDANFASELNRYLKLKKRRKNQPIWNVSRQTISRWADAISSDYCEKHGSNISVTPHTLRFSFGVNAVLHLVSLPNIKELMGHHRIESAVIYLTVLEVHPAEALKRVQF